jgi:hypothetical protein
MSQLEPDTLYVANCTGQSSCLEKVTDVGGLSALLSADGSTHQLEKGKRYNFIFKVPQGGMPNSLVVVQVKQVDLIPKRVAEGSPVRMQRYRIEFACYRRHRDATSPQWPPEGVPGRNLPSISYSAYDEFHRNGFTNADDDRLLTTKFHVRYFNGQTCVSTLDPVRRAQFLMHDTNNFAGRTESFLVKLGAYSLPANAGDDAAKQYERLKVVLSNYRRASDTQGCFGFSTKAGRSESLRLDVVVRDIERQVQAYPFDLSKSWSFGLH